MLGEDMGHYVLATTALSDANREGPGGAINGGFYPKKADWPAQHPSIVIAVADITASMTKVAQAGGEVLGDSMRIPGIGLYVSFFDTEGNRVSLLGRSSGERQGSALGVPLCGAFGSSARGFIGGERQPGSLASPGRFTLVLE